MDSVLKLDMADEDELRPVDIEAISAGLRGLDLMEGAADRPAGSKGEGPTLAAELFPAEGNGGFGVQWLPPDLFDADVRHLAYRIVRDVYGMAPVRNPLMAAVYRMLSRLADEGVETNMETVTLGLLLGAAKVHKVKLRTHPRDLAKLAGARYATLLKVRRAAIAELS